MGILHRAAAEVNLFQQCRGLIFALESSAKWWGSLERHKDASSRRAYAPGPIKPKQLHTDDDEDSDDGRPTTPWIRQVISGVDLMRHPKYNKGLAFSDSERDRLYLRGLLPPVILSQEVQLERTMLNLRTKSSDLDKYTYMQSLQERNERLFFRVLVEHFEELKPVMSDATVREACRRYGLMFKSVPRALFITLEDRGRVFRILKNWPERNVQMVAFTDGEKTAGDVGVQAVGVPISKLSLYSACGGINPAGCLPVVIDSGTDNEELLKSPFYVGMRHRRVRGDAYYELLDEFLTAVRQRYGNTTFLHFEDMAHDNASKLLNMYRTEFPCYNDDMSGSAATVLAGILAALPKIGGRLGDHVYMFSGESAMASCIAELLATAIAQQTNQTVLAARKRIWFVDNGGLVTRERGDTATLEPYKLPFTHSGPAAGDLLTAVKEIKPTVLVGLDNTPEGPKFKFDEQVCRIMAATTRHPLFFPLSELPEVTAEDAYKWTNGTCLMATSEFTAPPVVLAGSVQQEPGQCTTTYIFPGIVLGALVSGCTKLRDDQFVAAAEAVSRMVNPEMLAHGTLYPPLNNIREVAVHVAKAVAQKAYENGYATALPKPHNLYEAARAAMYNPRYRRYR
mmetsp:Transcript_19147/g.53619  ORF Transcript_19147/g.53619 Transcript_19147/m.53619 type:complete len:624 (+) Transcript_19147:96-1967(+)